MNLIYFGMLASLILCSIQAQTVVAFKLNMKALIDKNLFQPSNNEKIFIRGSFNNWNGDDYELNDENTDRYYRGVFKIDVGIEDTLEYKFVIKKNDGRYYWEKNPDPLNPNYGNRKLIISSDTIILPEAAFSYDEYIKYPVIFRKEKLREDFIQMRRALEENHPALYDYTGKKILDSLFDFSYTLLDTNMEFNKFYKITSSALERVGCGHTKLWIPSEYWNSAPQRFFPLKLIFIKNKAYVCGYYTTTKNILLGSEIVEINGKPIEEIINSLISVTSSDAFIRAFKLKTVEKNFSPGYALYYDYPEYFKIKFVLPGESETRESIIIPADGKTISKNPTRGNKLTLKLYDNNRIAVLTINSFIYYDRLNMFRSFIDSSFREIKTHDIKNLILDLRGNDGGDPFCSSYLLSYIENKPVPYFAEPYGRYEELAEPIPRARNNFKGNLFTLIDGSGFSTTGHFCALLKFHKIGKLVGTETGATYTCTGSVQYLNLKNTGIIFGTARKHRYSAAVKNMDRSRGILPDYQVEKTPGDIISNKDVEMDFVLDLIKNNSE